MSSATSIRAVFSGFVADLTGLVVGSRDDGQVRPGCTDSLQGHGYP